MTEHIALLAHKFGQARLHAVALSSPFGMLAVVELLDAGRQNLDPVWSEQASTVDRVHSIEEGVLPHVDGARMLIELV